MKQIIPVIFALSLGCCASGENQDDNAGEKPYTRITLPGIDGTRIAWDYSSMRQLAPEGGYARVLPLADGTIAAVYEAPGGAYIRTSRNNGSTWETARKVFSKHTYTDQNNNTTDVNIANAELIQLRNGDLIYGVNYRPARNGVAPFAIVVSRSTDGGTTWCTPQVLYEADSDFNNGCWEPCFLELPDGTVQVYFANENPFRNSNEQEISLLSSSDNGVTWSTVPVRACFREGHRDGMPVPAIFGDEIVVAIEDDRTGKFHPYTVRSKIEENWSQPVLADSPMRNYALKTPMPEEVYMGAPYLIATPSGESLLSYQSTRNRTDKWDLSIMEVAVGDAHARNFDRISFPFKIPLTSQGLWNSLRMLDEYTVAAVTSSNFQGTYSPWMIKGYLLPDLKAERRTITVDGMISTQEWGNYLPVFVGHIGQTNLRSAIAYDDRYLYLCAKVNDQTATPDSGDKADGVTFAIDAQNACITAPDEGIYQIRCTSSGRITVAVGRAGEWVTEKSTDILHKVTTNNDAGYYSMEVAVPFAYISKKGFDPMRLTVTLTDSRMGDSYNETIVNANINAPYTWCKVNF